MPLTAARILLIEDNPGDVRLVRAALAEIAKTEFELIHWETAAQGLESIEEHKPDVILLDLGLPDSQGLETVRLARAAGPDVPLVVLTVNDDGNLAVQSLQEGAQDYLVKEQINGASLWHAIRYAMERQRVQLELLNAALIDDLTGLNNRRGFLALAEHQMSVARRTGKPFLVAFVDLDGMKGINDTFGHQEGNRAIVDASNVLRDSFRQSDVIARIGGDEFAAVITDASENSIETVLQRIQRKLDSCNARPGRGYGLSFSIGIVAANATQTADIEQLLSTADALMYEQKRNKGASRETVGSETKHSGKVKQIQ